DDLLDLGVDDPPRGARAGLVGQPLQTVLEEASPPLANGRHGDAQGGGGGGVGAAVGGGQDDAGAEGEPLGGFGPAGPGLQLGTLVVGQGQGLQTGHGSPPKKPLTERTEKRKPSSTDF